MDGSGRVEGHEQQWWESSRAQSGPLTKSIVGMQRCYRKGRSCTLIVAGWTTVCDFRSRCILPTFGLSTFLCSGPGCLQELVR